MRAVRKFCKTLVQTSVVFLGGAASGVFMWGYHRWLHHGDWRVLGALFRILGAVAISAVMGFYVNRFVDPDPQLFVFMLRIGFGVGVAWALVWVLFLYRQEPFDKS